MYMYCQYFCIYDSSMEVETVHAPRVGIGPYPLAIFPFCNFYSYMKNFCYALVHVGAMLSSNTDSYHGGGVLLHSRVTLLRTSI